MRRLIVGLAAASTLLVAGCSPDPEPPSVVVMSGVQGQQEWQILASKDEAGELCLELRLTGPDPLDTAGCGFGAGDGNSRNLSWEADDGTSMLFGPVSAAAVRVRVTEASGKVQEVATEVLPADLVKGRLYAVSVVGDDDPSITPLDEAGAEVPAQVF